MAKVLREVIKTCDGCGLCVIRGEVKDRPMFAGLLGLAESYLWGVYRFQAEIVHLFDTKALSFWHICDILEVRRCSTFSHSGCTFGIPFYANGRP